MRAAAAVRRGGGRGDDDAGHLPARAGAEAGADCVCAAEPPAGGRALWGEPEPAVPPYADAGDSEAAAGERIQEMYLESLEAMGIDLGEHDIKFEEDNWEWPVGGAWGVGWQVMLDGLEITQFTYFQQCGGMDLDPICGEITYGMERIAGFLQDVDSIYDIVWAVEPDTGQARDVWRDAAGRGGAVFGVQLRLRGCGEAVGAPGAV